MRLNLRKRFLLMFEDYRNAIEVQQAKDDELLRLRLSLDSITTELARERAESIQRERDMNDRLMRMRFGDRILSSPTVPIEDNPQTGKSPLQFQSTRRQQATNARQEFYQQLHNRRQSLLNNDGQHVDSAN